MLEITSLLAYTSYDFKSYIISLYRSVTKFTLCNDASKRVILESKSASLKLAMRCCTTVLPPQSLIGKAGYVKVSGTLMRFNSVIYSSSEN